MSRFRPDISCPSAIQLLRNPRGLFSRSRNAFRGYPKQTVPWIAAESPMPLVPHRFLFRITHSCRYHGEIPVLKSDRILDLSEAYSLDNLAYLDDERNFADVRFAWNDLGFGVQVDVRGKTKEPEGNLSRPRGSDGISLWIDTRDARSGHRGTRFCHQFHFLASGGGPDQDEPAVVQGKIHRALEDSPHAPAASIPVKVRTRANGYLLEAFLPASALNGFDPGQHPRWGIFYAVRDEELGEQLLSLTPEFPFWEDPSLWSTLELVR